MVLPSSRASTNLSWSSGRWTLGWCRGLGYHGNTLGSTK
ncbi:hypothetical protein [Klebsiella phage vB_KpnM-VAC25]|uniref:Uncharacterized protein n=1 Tax=Klebsiella phage vB_KpnM-VAC25 TaxID=2866703 RepID=A0A976QNL8_9CAUD|nr:hypothetical protein [Klebsiella phage vB_KpnM-VAC25]